MARRCQGALLRLGIQHAGWVLATVGVACQVGPASLGSFDASIGDEEGSALDEGSGSGNGRGGGTAGSAGDEAGTTGDDYPTATFTHRFGTSDLAPFQDTPDVCVQWTLDNDEALYVQAVMLSNLGYLFHSNWFVVPEDTYPGGDGYFDCADRGFSQLGSAAVGTVLFAQSTQTLVDEQRAGAGAVIKIPPRHAVVGGIHLLNLGPAPVDTDLFMTLEIIHPKWVETVLAPFRLTYNDLDIPAQAESRFIGNCDSIAESYVDAAGHEMDLELHYILPNHNYWGNHFGLTVLGGAFDGLIVYEHDGFKGLGMGKTFDPPIDLSDAEGLRWTCGYDNPLDTNLSWGHPSDGELCVMLGLAESDVLMDISTQGGSTAIGPTPEGILQFEGTCGSIGTLDKLPAQAIPSAEELAAPLYVPPLLPEDLGIPAVPVCSDHDPSVEPAIDPTLTNVFGALFDQSCALSSCHGEGAAGGLNFRAPDLHIELLDHQTIANPGMALVEPGDPDNSWLYQILSQCEPMGQGGAVSHMPHNSPVLLDDSLVALVREWIAAGALDN